MLKYEIRRNGARVQRVPIYNHNGEEFTFNKAIIKESIESYKITLPSGDVINCNSEFRIILERKLQNMVVLNRESARVLYEGETIELSIEDIKYLIAVADLHEEEITHG